MIQVFCPCGLQWQAAESEAATPQTCPRCGQITRLVSAEQLPDGAGAADFDAALVPLNASQQLPVRFLLGGVAEIHIGKLPDKHIVLPGQLVSRLHCKLTRIDFGPSRWRLDDNHSTNGLFINGQRITQQELNPGDIIKIGEYELKYVLLTPPAASTPAVASAASSPAATTAQPVPVGHSICPSCERPVPPGTRICVDCGIYIDTGRPLLTSQAIDEDALYVRTENWVRFLSFWIWVTPMPMPIASEAYGGLKPYVIWTVAILTAIASIAFYVAMDGTEDAPARVLMLWPPHAHPVAPRLTKEQLRQLIRDMTPQQQDVLEKKLTELHGRVDRDTLWQILKAAKPDLPDPPVEPFQWWQLWTHTLLHDPGSLFGLLGHLGGNMLFLLVFGTRVNALIGQTKMVFLYPLLAVAAAEAHLWAMGSNPPALPLLGASGVIMGLAGMYLVLFPAHRVYCAMWIRILIGLRLWGVKIFAIRGFWVLLIYFAYDLTMAWLLGAGGAGVAHFAHIGGFLTGVLIAVLLLLTRQVDARGGDLLTLLLGKRAWSLIGRPAHRRKPLPAPHPTPAASGTP